MLKIVIDLPGSTSPLLCSVDNPFAKCFLALDEIDGTAEQWDVADAAMVTIRDLAAAFELAG